MIEGKVTLASEDKIYNSSRLERSSQDSKHYTDARNTFSTAYIGHS